MNIRSIFDPQSGFFFPTPVRLFLYLQFSCRFFQRHCLVLFWLRSVGGAHLVLQNVPQNNARCKPKAFLMFVDLTPKIDEAVRVFFITGSVVLTG